jgi:hypothetical protein
MTNTSLFIRLSLAFFLLATVAVAQEPEASPAVTPAPTPASNAKPAASPAPAGSTAAIPKPSVSPTPKVIKMNGHLELDEVLEVFVENLEQWAETHDPNKLVPYINGRAIKGNYPDEIHLERGRLIFHLQITQESRDPWIDLLGEPSSTHRPVTLSVGLENGSAFDTVYEKENTLPLTVINPLYGIIALLVIAITLVLLLWLCRSTNIIREPGPPPITGKRRPYNLGRAQMAFWFFLIYASYMTIWLITSALDTITASLLALMGISAGTALGEALIDNGKDTARTNQNQELTAQKEALIQTLDEVQPQVDAANTSAATTVTDQANRDSLNRQLVQGRTRLSQVEQQLRALTIERSPQVSQGFLRDILSDGSGYSFHRFQIFAWTIVLGIIFISSVYNDLTMPEFSPTLLGLMGLSAGTYIGFKFPEQK